MSVIGDSYTDIEVDKEVGREDVVVKRPKGSK